MKRMLSRNAWLISRTNTGHFTPLLNPSHHALYSSTSTSPPPNTTVHRGKSTLASVDPYTSTANQQFSADSVASAALNFDDARAAFKSKSTAELLRANVVFQLSAFPAFVQNSRALLNLSERVLGKSLTHFALKKTFFGHFCAGENAQDIAPTIEKLRQAGIGAILDYAAEADVGSTAASTPEQHVRTFLSCIATAAKQQNGVAAIKVTGLAQPELLERLSTWIAQASSQHVPIDNVISNSATPQDLQQLSQLRSHLNKMADSARSQSVRLLIDAEQTYFQPAIDMLVRELQQAHNRTFPTIFNTYQCYLRDSYDRIQSDLRTADQQGYIFAAKIVRGAYMIQERKLAAANNRPDPIHPTAEATHQNYDRVAETLLLTKQPRELMIASHNEKSILRALDLMRENHITRRSSGIMFGQLLGMCDHVSYTLGQNGYSVYKYVPYGPVGEVIPYLVRRAEENSSFMTGAQKERTLLRQELLNRFGLFSSKQ